ncbi:Aste57867_14540 [Aphanomyces stellatus]|uniref:Aste57867_14540 protein n=1 Tax=Aphanomyces stellatus TaxID=120398 RepID=A0A485L100_9STRA|nr:hypothetical protein As57867_014486 [Aphanomyces stellatus]VFT91362.1 Aste57867_14540 [Aphanomyces stellatus]
MALFAVALSVATYFVVENNLRRRKSPIVTLVLFGCMLAIVGVGAGAYAFPDVFSIPMRRIAAFSHRQEAFLNANMELLSADEKDNWSKPPRLAEPTVEGIYAALDWSWSNWFNYTGFTHLSEKEDKSVWHVLNQRGTGPVVAALGDSHLTMLAPRFKHLHDVATAANQLFPTMY